MNKRQNPDNYKAVPIFYPSHIFTVQWKLFNFPIKNGKHSNMIVEYSIWILSTQVLGFAASLYTGETRQSKAVEGLGTI